VSDIAAGMYAYSGVLAALLERGRTGQGAVVDVSMLESTVEWMGFPLYYSYAGAPPPPRAGPRTPRSTRTARSTPPTAG
jgi:crotonobetainyl-CoA:carnitine CoA-transferase CaiB-like acyl-CoA transferase